MSATATEAVQDQLGHWYPRFNLVAPPLGSAAVRAFIGRIQPFPNEKEYAGVMSHLEQGELVTVHKQGRLAHPTTCKIGHIFAFPFSALITTSFEILLLDFPGRRHARVYGVSPEISRRRFPAHPHLRDDQALVFNGKPLQALCIYLASDGDVERGDMELVQVLDFTSMYLARHALWLATNWAEKHTAGGQVVRTPNPGALARGDHGGVFDGTAGIFATYYRTDAALETREQQLRKWTAAGEVTITGGRWIGKEAPHFRDQLYRQIAPRQECHCGSGEPYGNCCRKKDAVILGLR